MQGLVKWVAMGSIPGRIRDISLWHHAPKWFWFPPSSPSIFVGGKVAGPLSLSLTLISWRALTSVVELHLNSHNASSYYSITSKYNVPPRLQTISWRPTILIKDFRCFPWSTQQNIEIVSQIMPRSHPPTSFPINFSLVIYHSNLHSLSYSQSVK
jgi:hypothetical protein